VIAPATTLRFTFPESIWRCSRTSAERNTGGKLGRRRRRLPGRRNSEFQVKDFRGLQSLMVSLLRGVLVDESCRFAGLPDPSYRRLSPALPVLLNPDIAPITAKRRIVNRNSSYVIHNSYTSLSSGSLHNAHALTPVISLGGSQPIRSPRRARYHARLRLLGLVSEDDILRVSACAPHGPDRCASKRGIPAGFGHP